MFLITAALVAAAFAGPLRDPDQGEQAKNVRRIAATAALAAEEYGVGVKGRRNLLE